MTLPTPNEKFIEIQFLLHACTMVPRLRFVSPTAREEFNLCYDQALKLGAQSAYLQFKRTEYNDNSYKIKLSDRQHKILWQKSDTMQIFYIAAIFRHLDELKLIEGTGDKLSPKIFLHRYILVDIRNVSQDTDHIIFHQDQMTSRQGTQPRFFRKQGVRDNPDDTQISSWLYGDEFMEQFKDRNIKQGFDSVHQSRLANLIDESSVSDEFMEQFKDRNIKQGFDSVHQSRLANLIDESSVSEEIKNGDVNGIFLYLTPPQEV